MLPLRLGPFGIGAFGFALVLGTASSARMADTCPRHFAGGRAPTVLNAALARETVSLCYEGFTVLYSGLSRTPVYAAERLTRESIAAARRIDRAEFFHEEDRLPAGQRAWLADYVRSGYDRGHMAPAGDMATETAQAESFTLANMVPQNRTSNRFLWSDIEESVRRLAVRRGELFVVTGPIYSGAHVQAIGSGVLVPSQLYKAVYDPARNEAAAYLVTNDASEDWQAVPIARLTELAGLDPFPAQDRALGAKTATMRLPGPYATSRDRNRASDDTWGTWLLKAVFDVLGRLWAALMRAIF